MRSEPSRKRPSNTGLEAETDLETSTFLAVGSYRQKVIQRSFLLGNSFVRVILENLSHSHRFVKSKLANNYNKYCTVRVWTFVTHCDVTQ